jgi:hypothetical protein
VAKNFKQQMKLITIYFFNIFFNLNKNIINQRGIYFILFIFYLFKLQNNCLTFSLLIIFLLGSIFILLIFNYIYNNKNRKFIKQEYISIIKDKEFIIFKNNLFNLYYTTIILLIFFLFKNNIFILLLDFNFYFIFLFLSICLFYLFLISNFFILFLFNLYLDFNKALISLKNINLDPIHYYNKKKKFLFTQIKSFSTSTKFNNIKDKDLETNDNLVDFIDLTKTEAAISSNKKDLKNFKKIFGGGYLGYKYIRHFGSVYFDPKEKMSYIIKDLDIKIIEYLNEIPDDVVYSVLPFIR